MSDPFDDDEPEECDCSERVPAGITEEWVCPDCDMIWYPEEEPPQ